MPTGTILVSDLVASTDLRARLGDEAAERLRRTHDRLLRTAVETHGGVVIKGLGDGVLASFTGATEGLAAAVAIQQAADAHTQHHPDLPLVLRVGLSAGDVTLDGGDVFGTPVVEAARLCAAARACQILAADVVRLLVKGRAGIQFNAVGELALKGLTEPVATLEVPWERPAAVALPFPDLLRTGDALDFTGRTSELELLNAAWKEAQAGERRSVLVGGEPGMGKTRLAAELARSVHPGGAVLYGRCQEGLGVPYEPFVEALSFFCEHTAAHELRSRLGRYPGELVRLLPDLADLVPGLDPPLRSDPETEQYRLFEAVSSWLAAAGEAGGLLVVVDDLHWAPAPTLSLLVHVLRSATPARLLVVATFRDTEIGPALSATLADLRRTSTERVSLTGLSVDELSELLERLSHHAEAGPLHEETKGNPFFIGEILRHLESGVVAVPESVREVIVARVARLAPATATLLGVAAVFGRDIELQPLAAVAGVDAREAVEALDEALTARLMEEVEVGGYRFVHALVRSALYETLSANKRAQLHLRAAEAYEDDVAQLAHHLVACAPLAEDDRTARACLAAGDRALTVLADAEAADWYSRGLAFVTEADPTSRIDLLTGLGDAQRRVGDPASRQTLLDATRLAADCGDVDRLVRAVLANSRGIFSVTGEVDGERLELIGTALDLVGTAPSAERAELLSLQAVELVFAGDHERVLRAADEAAAIAARLDDLVRARVGVRCLWACAVPDRLAGLAMEARDLVGLTDSTGDPQLRVLSRRPTPLLTIGALTEARAWMIEEMAIAEESGQPGLRSRAHFEYAGVLDALGDHQEAERLTQVAFDLGQQAAWPDAVQFYGGRMAVHWVYEGQPEVVVAMAAQAVAQTPRLVAWRAGWALGLALSGGDEELAGFLKGLTRLLPEIPFDHFWLSAHLMLAVSQGFGVEEAGSAELLYEILLPYRALHASYGIGYWGPVEVGLAVAARVTGRLDEALLHHEAAAATIEACGAARPRALNGYQWARTLLARDAPGDRKRAAELADETVAYCRAKGYTTLVTKTEEFLAAL